MPTRFLNLLKQIIGINGDTWEKASQDINDNWDKIDQHDHTSGNGKPIKVDALDIDKNVNFNEFGLNNLSFVNFASLSSDSEAEVGSFYRVGNIFKFKASENSIINLAQFTPETVSSISVRITGSSLFFDFITSSRETISSNGLSLTTLRNALNLGGSERKLFSGYHKSQVNLDENAIKTQVSNNLSEGRVEDTLFSLMNGFLKIFDIPDEAGLFFPFFLIDLTLVSDVNKLRFYSDRNGLRDKQWVANGTTDIEGVTYGVYIRTTPLGQNDDTGFIIRSFS